MREGRLSRQGPSDVGLLRHWGRKPVEDLAACPVGGNQKRAFDFILAVVGLICLSPIAGFISILIKLGDGGPVLYRHKRIGRNGAEFDCLKFRTMAVNAEAILARHLAENEHAADEWRERHKLKTDPRVTPLGTILRKTSVDELPQLLNIIKGEMSMVGPRPIVRAEIVRYGVNIEKYYTARPGITGIWQVSGRNDTSYHDRVRLDGEYVTCWTFWRDLIILAKTFRAVVTARGCY